MRTNIVRLVILAGLGVSGFGTASAEAKNLSCISGISPGEQRLLRDCEPEPQEIYPVIEVVNEVPPPPPPPEPARMKHGEGGKGNGQGRDKDRDSPAGGRDSGGPHGAAN